MPLIYNFDERIIFSSLEYVCNQTKLLTYTFFSVTELEHLQKYLPERGSGY